MKYFRLISIIAMALSILRNLFRLTEENSIANSRISIVFLHLSYFVCATELHCQL